ncbi:MAG: hypothetical protein AAGB51_15195 [Planctomycetota bacterium]
MSRSRTMTAAFAWLAMASPVLAQDSDAPEQTDADRPTETSADQRPGSRPIRPIIGDGRPSLEPSYSFSVDSTYQYSAPVDDDLGEDLGEVSKFSITANLGVMIPIDEQSSLSLSFADKTTDYNFTTGGVGLITTGGDPFDIVRTNSIGLRYARRFNETFQPYVAGGVTSSRARDASFEQSFTFAGLLGTRIVVNDELDITLGGGLASRLEGNFLFVPGFGVNWRPTDRLTIGTNTLPRGGSLGGGGGISYKLDDSFTLGFNVNFERDEFRIDEGREPIKGGVARDSSLFFTLTSRWTPSPRWIIDASVSVVTERELQLLDRSGLERSDLRFDNALGVGVGVEYRF